MMVSISSRLDRLKAKVPEPMTVICKLPTGEETVLPVDRCIQARADFIRVKSGAKLEDVRRLLDYISGPNCAIH